MGTLHDDIRTFMISCRIILKMRNVSDKSCRELQTYVLCSATLFRKSFRLWDNVEKCSKARECTDGNIIRPMRFACLITKATHTHTHWEYVILIGFPRRQWLRERFLLLRYTYFVCLVYLYNRYSLLIMKLFIFVSIPATCLWAGKFYILLLPLGKAFPEIWKLNKIQGPNAFNVELLYGIWQKYVR